MFALGVFCFFMAGFLPASAFIQHSVLSIPIQYIFQILALGFILIPLLKKITQINVHSVLVSQYTYNYLCFSIPFAVSFFLLCFSIIYNHDLGNLYFISHKNFTRTLNILWISICVLGILYLLPLNKDTFLKVYGFFLFLIMLTVIMQIGYFYFGMPFPNLNLLRTQMHSLEGTDLKKSYQRLTGFCLEPSFLAPYIVEFTLIFLFFFKKRKRNFILYFSFLPIIAIVILSFSPSLYINFLFVFVFVIMFLFKKMLNIRYLLLILTVLVGVYFFTPISDLIYPVILRVENDLGKNTSNRFYMVSQTPKWFWESGHFLKIIFGQGPASYANLQFLYQVPTGEPVHNTSNNIFIDNLYEYGIFGLFALILFFVLMAKRSFKIKGNHRFLFVSFYIHLFISECYRGDYVNPRFWSVFLTLAAIEIIDLEERNSSIALNAFA